MKEISNQLMNIIESEYYSYSRSTYYSRRSAVRKLDSFLICENLETVDLEIMVRFKESLINKLCNSSINTYINGHLIPLLRVLDSKWSKFDFYKSKLYLFRLDLDLSDTKQICFTEFQLSKLTSHEVTREEYNGYKPISSSNKNISYEEFKSIKDLFVIQCLSAVSISDLPKLVYGKIDESTNTIRYYRLKTNVKAEVTISKELRSLINKYSTRDISFYKSSTVNDYIRYICKCSGLTEEVKIKCKGQEILKPIYELVHSHTGRHTFINILLRRGVSVDNIKKATGHKCNKSVLKVYSHLSEEELDSYKFFSSYFSI